MELSSGTNVKCKQFRKAARARTYNHIRQGIFIDWKECYKRVTVHKIIIIIVGPSAVHRKNGNNDAQHFRQKTIKQS